MPGTTCATCGGCQSCDSRMVSVGRDHGGRMAAASCLGSLHLRRRASARDDGVPVVCTTLATVLQVLVGKAHSGSTRFLARHLGVAITNSMVVAIEMISGRWRLGSCRRAACKKLWKRGRAGDKKKARPERSPGRCRAAELSSVEDSKVHPALASWPLRALRVANLVGPFEDLPIT